MTSIDIGIAMDGIETMGTGVIGTIAITDGGDLGGIGITNGIAKRKAPARAGKLFVIDRTKKGLGCRTKRMIRSHAGILGSFSPGTIAQELDNAGS
jgi:hypothetical protein